MLVLADADATAEPTRTLATLQETLALAEETAVAVLTLCAEEAVVKTVVTAEPNNLYLTADAAVEVTLTTTAAPSLKKPSRPNAPTPKAPLPHPLRYSVLVISRELHQNLMPESS